MYEDEKRRYEQVYQRELTDKEMAEAMYERWQDTEEKRVRLLSDYDELREEYGKAMDELRKPRVPDKWVDMVAKIEDIQIIPAKNKTIYITIDENGVRIDCNIVGMFE